MSRADRINQLLIEQLKAVYLIVRDDSHLHEGHAGARPEGETHFYVMVVSLAFEGKSRVERHRLVNKALASEFDLGLHALQIEALTPDEGEKQTYDSLRGRSKHGLH